MADESYSSLKMENEGKFDETSYLTELSSERDKLPSEYQHASRLLNQEIQRNQPGAGKDGQTTKPPILDIHKGRPLKLLVRVSVPIKDHPNFNFIGKLLGPKGNSLKRLQEETQTRMAILGRGSMRDKAKEEELRSKGDPKYSHLNEELHVEISAFALPSDAYARMAHALSEVKRFLVPDYYDEIRQDQLRELAVLNGTPGGPPPPPPPPPPKPGFNQPPHPGMPPAGAPGRLGRPMAGRGRGYPPPPPPPPPSAPVGRGAAMPGPPKPAPPSWRPPPRAMPPPPAVSGAGRGMMKQRMPEGPTYPPHDMAMKGRGGGLHDNGHVYENAYKDQEYGNVYEEMGGEEEYAEPYHEDYESNTYGGEQAGGYGGDQGGYGESGYAEPCYSEPGYSEPEYLHDEWSSGIGRGARLKSMPAPRSLNRANVRSHPYGPPPPPPVPY